MDNCCRWCKWFKDGCCINEDAFDSEIDVSNFWEDGILSDAIKEGLKDIKFNKVKKLLETKVSRKTQIAVMELLNKEFTESNIDLIIASSVTDALIKFIKDAFYEGIYIKNPNEFICELFW